jgi:glutathione synthase
MKHIMFIDPIEKLVPKKDSTLMLASTMKKQGMDVTLLFEKDFFVNNQGETIFRLYDFDSEFYEDGAYLKKFTVTESNLYTLKKKDVLHMRIDPPFDTRYLRYLWMLRFLQQKGISVLNSPDGILKHNEKLHAYSQPSSLHSYVGSSPDGFLEFVSHLKGTESLILKPLDLFQGMGVEKVAVNRPDLLDVFHKKVAENNGAIVAQPFVAEVAQGEIRSLYFKGKELGSILKVPKQGEFLANIAQGASFNAIELDSKIKKECDEICAHLMTEGVDWVAFDILGGHVSEINITCPGLLTEVSFAHKKNYALEIINKL